MKEVFLICALSVQPYGWKGEARIKAAQMAKSEKDQLIDWLRKNNPDADVFIHPNPQADKLKEYGYERVPFRWRNNEIWIQRKPKHDRGVKDNAKRTIESAA